MKIDDLKSFTTISYHADVLVIPVLIPSGRDAELVMDLIRKESLTGIRCQTFDMLYDSIKKGSGPVVIAEEALTNSDIQKLFEWISAQPEWSDLPLIVVSYNNPSPLFHTLALKHNITFLKHPVHVLTFTSVIRTDVEARKRQYQIHNLLTEHIILNEKLDHRADQLQELALELTNTEHRKRRRIAETIHDELQQMLVGAQMKLNIMKMEPETDSIQEQKLDEIEKIITDTLDVARTLSYELAPPVLQYGNLTGTLQWLAEHMKEEYNLDTRFSVEHPDLDVNESLRVFLFQSVRELLFNVVKHAGILNVELKVEECNNRIMIKVSDSGKGFDPDVLRMKGGKSGGFGLFSISERLDLLGGWLDIESQLGFGSRFTLVSPPLKTASNQIILDSLSISNRNISTQKNEDCDFYCRVLVTDDHAVFRKGLIAMLQREVHIEVVGEASNGEAALEAARRLHPDVVLMDVSMPVMNGIEATAKISSEFPDIRIIGLSMFEDSMVQKRMMENGAVAFLTKNVDARQLMRTIYNNPLDSEYVSTAHLVKNNEIGKQLNML